jgi:hypothetical protein
MFVYHNAQRYILYSWYIQFISESVVGTLADIYNETLGNIYNINHSKETGSPRGPVPGSEAGREVVSEVNSKVNSQVGSEVDSEVGSEVGSRR